MSESKHTPGPWTFDGRFCTNDGAVAVTAPHPELGKTRIALVDIQCKAKRGHGWETPCPERDANAKLIAASPEMLEVLERFMHYHQTMIDLGGQKEPFDKQMIRVLAEMQGEIVDKMKSAIKKARGSDV